MDEEFGIQINESESIVVEGSFYNYNRSRKSYVAWLFVDSKPVGMIRYLIGGSEYDVPCLCDIEIRKEARGKGLGVHFIKLLEEHIINGTLYTSGHYTPEGFRSLSPHLPLLPQSVEWGEEPMKCFNSMTFVQDFDALRVK